MEVVLIDTSKDWVGIVVGEELILKVLDYRLRKKFGKPVHMRELRLSEKFSVLRVFNYLFSERGVKLYSLKPRTNNWWTGLIRNFMGRRIRVLYVDLEVYEELKRKVHSSYLKLLNIYINKERAQFADILAYGDSHYKFVKNIWKDLSIKRGESQLGQ